MILAYDTSDGTIIEALNNKADIDLNNLSADDKLSLIEEHKETIIGWMMPDYNNYEELQQDVEYIASDNCWIYVDTLSTSSNSGGHVHKAIIIDDVTVYEVRSFYYTQTNALIPCSKGSKYKIKNVNSGSGTYTLKVYHCKGLN